MNDDPDDTDPLRRALLALVPALVFADSAHAQDAPRKDAARIQPDSYRVAFENDQLRVLDFQSRPGMGVCGVGMHSHPPHLTVTLTPGKVRLTNPDGTTAVSADVAGHAFWTEAVTHQTENVMGLNMRALIIELKNPCVRRT